MSGPMDGPTSAPLRYVPWDFGDTLADQDWMLAAPEGFPAWPRTWTQVARGEAEHAWNVNAVTCEEIARRVSSELGMPLPAVRDHIRHCCEHVRFLDAPLRAAERCALAQALVTVNPDVFTRHVVPHHRLDARFPVIVASWQEGTDDKAQLCELALRRMGGTGRHAQALLIDDLETNVRAWERRGGRGYLFRGEARFAADLASELRELAGGGAP